MRLHCKRRCAWQQRGRERRRGLCSRHDCNCSSQRGCTNYSSSGSWAVQCCSGWYPGDFQRLAPGKSKETSKAMRIPPAGLPHIKLYLRQSFSILSWQKPFNFVSRDQRTHSNLRSTLKRYTQLVLAFSANSCSYSAQTGNCGIHCIALTPNRSMLACGGFTASDCQTFRIEEDSTGVASLTPSQTLVVRFFPSYLQISLKADSCFSEFSTSSFVH